MLTTTDHKLIGQLYLVTSFVWFLLGGLMALAIRAELFAPGQQVVNEELYNQKPNRDGHSRKRIVTALFVLAGVGTALAVMLVAGIIILT